MPETDSMESADLPAERGLADDRLSPRIRSALEQFRNRLWSLKIAEGALSGIVGLTFSFLLAFLCDRLMDPPQWLRWSLLGSGLIAPFLIFPVIWHRWVWRRRSLNHSARMIRRRLPGFGDELLGIVELAQEGSSRQNRTLVTAAMRQVEARIGEQQLVDLLHEERRRNLQRAVSVMLLLITGLFILAPRATAITLVRWVAPWKPIPRYVFARIEPPPTTMTVAWAESFPLTFTLASDTDWQPSHASLRLTSGERLKAQKDENRYSFSIAPLKDESLLHYRIGDAVGRIRIEPRLRPELRELVAVTRLPDYLRRTEDLVLPIRGEDLAVVEGSSVIVRGTASSELISAEMNENPIPREGTEFSTPALSLESPLSLTLTWEDVHGLRAKSPLHLAISSVPDKAAEIYAHLVEDKRFVLEGDALLFDLVANDDFGVQAVGLQWRPAEEQAADREAKTSLETAGEKIVAAGAPNQTSLQIRGVFSSSRENLPPGIYEVRAFALDYLPGRERSLSPAFPLRILSRDEHVRWLAEEFRKWLRGARESFEREQQAHETNQGLHALSNEELDDPKARDQLQTQASSESANAQRLEALSKAGRSLIEEATKNPDFEARQLEHWAEKVQSLSEIGSTRMPKVADLLRQSSRAPSAEIAAPSEEAPARQPLSRSLKEQSELLKEFAQVVDELEQLLAGMESSTFVNRLKAASKAQTELAEELTTILADSFGTPWSSVPQKLRVILENIRTSEESQSVFIRQIQSDLEAYYLHKQEAILKAVLDQMKDLSAITAIRDIGLGAIGNLSGRTISSCEFWADTLDRWAEELVPAASDQDQNAQEQNEAKSLPPEITLQIMRALRKQIQIREETREAENAHGALTHESYAARVAPIEKSQTKVREDLDATIKAVDNLPDAGAFGNERQLLEAVSDLMRRSSAVLIRPDTGPETIAYQTEAIELLLQSKRQKSPSGGGGKSNGGSNSASGNGGGRQSGALSDIGPQSGELGAPTLPAETTTPATGRAGRELPDEFRQGLDQYFNKIEAAPPAPSSP